MLLFDRKIQLILEDGTILSSDNGVRIDFTYSTIADTGVPTAEIEILNLDEKTRKSFIEQQVILSVGYGDYLGELIIGDITNLEVEKSVVFDVLGANNNHLDYSNWYNTGTREDYIANDIAANSNMILTGSELLKNYSRPNGYSFKGNAIQSIQAICDNRGLGVTFRGKEVTIYEKIEKENQVIYLDDTSGLTNVTKYLKRDSKGNLDTTYDYIVHSLPIPTLYQGNTIEIKHDTYTGKLKVVDFEMACRRNWKAKYYCKM